MTRADAARLVAIVVTAYPNYDKFRDEAAVTATVNLWAMMFESDNAGLVGLAVKKHIATSKWPPSVAEIRELMLETAAPDLIPPDRAWLAVADLLHTEGQYNHGDLFTQLPPLIARAVEGIGWGNLWEMHRSYCVGGKPGMDRVAFMQQYTPMYEREKQQAMTPALIGEQIGNALAQLPSEGRQLLASREQKRRERDDQYRELYEARQDSITRTIEAMDREAEEKVLAFREQQEAKYGRQLSVEESTQIMRQRLAAK